MLSKETLNKIDELVSNLADGHLKMVKEHGVYWSDDLKDFGELLKNLASIQTPVVVSPTITVTGGGADVEQVVNQIKRHIDSATGKAWTSDLR